MKFTVYGGRAIDAIQPLTTDIHVSHIARGLSNVAKFGGQCSEFYSIAESSVFLSFLVPENLALEALLEHASDAYTGGMIRPYARAMPGHAQTVTPIKAAIRERYGLPASQSSVVAVHNERLFQLERREVHGENVELDYSLDAFPLFLAPKQARQMYLARFAEVVDQSRSERIRRAGE